MCEVTASRQRIRDRLLAFYTPDEAERWMLEPHPQLDGETANNALLQGRSVEVEAIIGRLEVLSYI